MNLRYYPLPLCVQNLADGSEYQFELLTNFVYRIGEPFTPLSCIVVPAGYRTDFASIPRPLQGIFNADNDVAPAAVIHDFLYSSLMVPRDRADEIFHEALRRNGVGKIRARVLWAGVRIGGWVGYGRNPAAASDWLARGAVAAEQWGDQ